MFIIIEWNGVEAKGIMGLVLDRRGNTKIFKIEKDAYLWASKNCAFKYQVVELR